MHTWCTVEVLLWRGIGHSPWRTVNSSTSASTSCDSRLDCSNFLSLVRSPTVQEFPEDPMACDSSSPKLLPSSMTSKSSQNTEKSSKALGLISKGIACDTILDWIGCARLERICAPQESPPSCCQEVVSETSGLPWCVVSKKSSNWQCYCGDTHPVYKFSTR